MDDILLAASRNALLDEAYSFVVTQLKEQNLVVAPEKVQKDVINCLDSSQRFKAAL